MGVRIVPGPAELPPVVLLHGVTWNAALNFHQVVPALAGSRMVVLMDHRGHGEGLPGAGPYAMEDLADDVVAVLDELGISRAVLVGFSLGSLTALQVAARRPDRVAGLVLTAGCLAMAPGRVLRAALWIMTWLLSALARVGAGHMIAPRYFGLNRRAPSAEFARAWPWIRRQLEANDPRFLAPAVRAALGHDLRPQCALIARTPTQVVVHERDALIPAALQWRMARELGADVVSIDADHEAPLSHPELYRDAVVAAVAALGATDAA
ncbi:hydrolase [Nocardioides phosphati]|uniref:Hydrolase n=1 Tax=Nocardioides phosphati TaxID=1867775 RepID=A0ABQ2NGC0_9ACTN|nr:alpha/beta hydrolase [Nocardioides phosphati]GGO93888.1 hydrolase [Nocardioides phosphati]